MSTLTFTTVPSKTLAASIDASAYSFQISDIIGWDGNALTAGFFGDYLYAVFRSSDNTVMELMSIDPTTIASSSITILKRGLSFNGDRTTETTAKKLVWVKNDTIIELGSTPPQLFQYVKDYIDGIAISGSPNATTTTKGIIELATAAEITAGTATGGTGAALVVTPDQLALSSYVPVLTPSGVINPYAGRSAPTGWLLCDGSAVSRTTYAALLAVIAPSGTFTVTIASPGVFTKTTHGYVAGDKLHFTTTGALPTGLSVNTDYYVITAGLTANAFEVALSPGGAAVNTSGSQSGIHTVYASAFGKGDGSTTFNLPNLGSRAPIGLSASAPTQTLTFEPAAVSAGSDNVTILDTVFPSQGQKVQLTSTGTLPAGLSLATDYWIVRDTTTTIKFATTQANANAATPVVVNITDTGTGVHTLTFTNRAHTVLGRAGGEETHGGSVGEIAGHSHRVYQQQTSASANNGALNSSTNGAPTLATGNPFIEASGSDAQHNNMPPFAVVNYIIKT